MYFEATLATAYGIASLAAPWYLWLYLPEIRQKARIWTGEAQATRKNNRRLIGAALITALLLTPASCWMAFLPGHLTAVAVVVALVIGTMVTAQKDSRSAPQSQPNQSTEQEYKPSTSPRHFSPQHLKDGYLSRWLLVVQLMVPLWAGVIAGAVLKASNVGVEKRANELTEQRNVANGKLDAQSKKLGEAEEQRNVANGKLDAQSKKLDEAEEQRNIANGKLDAQSKKLDEAEEEIGRLREVLGNRSLATEAAVELEQQRLVIEEAKATLKIIGERLEGVNASNVSQVCVPIEKYFHHSPDASCDLANTSCSQSCTGLFAERRASEANFEQLGAAWEDDDKVQLDKQERLIQKALQSLMNDPSTKRTQNLVKYMNSYLTMQIGASLSSQRRARGDERKAVLDSQSNPSETK